MGTQGVLLDKSNICKAIHDNFGIIEHAASQLGCAPLTIYRWMEKDEEVEKAVNEAREFGDKIRASKDEKLKELAYDSIEWLLKKRHATSTLATLEKLCKKWGRQQESSGPTSLTINLNKWSKDTSGSEIDKDN